MNELKEQKTRIPKPSGMSPEIASLNGLMGLLNNPAVTGAQVPKGEETKVKVPAILRTPAAAGPSLALAPIASTPSEPEEAPVPAPRIKREPTTRIFFTGVIASGKDFVASQAGAQVLGFADPIYALVNHLFGTSVSSTSGKEIPGVRGLLQTFGQWGRGVITERYPLTPARALFALHARSLAGVLPDSLMVDWASYGVNNDIWVDSLVKRAQAVDASRRLAVTNVRFEHEFKCLQSAGWTHYHVMCSAQTRAERQKAQGLDPVKSAALIDDSEQLARFLDADCIKKSRAVATTKLRVIWNDKVAPPSRRFFTLNEWLQEVAIGELPTESPDINME